MFGELLENPIFLFTIFETQPIEQPRTCHSTAIIN